MSSMPMSQIEKEFVELFERISAEQGSDSLLSKIYALSYINPEDISMEEVAEKTGYSLATISNKLRIFEKIGIILRYRKPGSKKFYLKVQRDFLKITRDLFVKKEEQNMKSMKASLPDIIKRHKRKDIDERSRDMLRIVEDMDSQIRILSETFANIISIMDAEIKKREGSIQKGEK